MKRRFKHSVFVFAFAALVVGVFLPLVISASKQSAEWFSPRTVLAAPVDARSSGVGSLLAAFRVGAGIHASLPQTAPYTRRRTETTAILELAPPPPQHCRERPTLLPRLHGLFTGRKV